MNIGALTVTLGVDTSGLTLANTHLLSWEKKTTTTLNRMSQRWRTYGYLASAALTLPIVVASKATFKAAKDFEFSMQKIVGLTGTAQDTVNAWREDLLKLGPELGKSPQELAEGLYFIASSGIAGSEAMNVLKLSAKAAASGLGETQTVAEYLTSALNAYRGTGLSAAYATDILVAAVRVGKAEASGFASAMGAVIPIASTMGVTLDQVAGAMAAITLTGSSAAQAATYLKGMFNILLKKSEFGEGAEALNSIKTSYEELRAILKSGGIIPVIEKIRKGMDAYGDTLVAKVFPNIRAMTGVLSLSGKNFEYNSKIMKEVTNSAGALGAAWAAVSNTIKIKFDKAISSAQVAMITLGKSVAEAVIPVLQWLVKQLQKLTEHFNSLSDSQKRFRIIVAAVVAALGPLLMIASVIGYSISGLISLVTKLSAVFIFMAKTILTAIRNQTMYNATLVSGMSNKAKFATTLINPWVLLTAAIGFATIALVKYMKKMDELPERVQNLRDSFKGIVAEEKGIEDMLSVSFAMDQGQLENFKNVLEQRLQILKDDRIKLLALRNDWFVDDKKYAKLQSDLLINTKNLEKWTIKKPGSVTANYFAKEVEKSRKALAKYTTSYMVGLDKDVAEFDKKIAGTLNSIKKVNEEVNRIQTDPILKAFEDQKKAFEDQKKAEQLALDIFEDLAKGELQISRMTKLLGETFDTAGEKTKLYNKILESLAKTTIPLTDKRLRELTGLIQTLSHQEFFKELEKDLQKSVMPSPVQNYDYSEMFSKLSGTRGTSELNFMKQFQTELDLITLKNKTLGESFNAGRAQLTYFKQVLEKLWDAGKRPGDFILDQVITRMKELTNQQYALDLLTDAFTDFFSITAKEFAHFDEFIKSWVNSVLRSFQRLIAELLAKKLATLLVSIFSAGAGTGIGALRTTPIAGLAQGGVVPPGYPKDTYPAMLTSGETVIPAGIGNLQNQTWGNQFETVVFEIREDRLRGILNKGNRKNNLY